MANSSSRSHNITTLKKIFLAPLCDTTFRTNTQRRNPLSFNLKSDYDEVSDLMYKLHRDRISEVVKMVLNTKVSQSQKYFLNPGDFKPSALMYEESKTPIFRL